MDSETFAKAQRALAEPKRVEIIEAIRRLGTSDGIACSVVLSEMNISQSTFSHHVSELGMAGLIREKKQGRFSLLSVDEESVSSYLDELRKRMLG